MLRIGIIGALVVAAIAGGLLLLSDQRPQVPLDATVVGFRYRMADGTAVFDDNALPLLRLSDRRAPAVYWQSAAGAGTALVDSAAVDDGSRLRVRGWQTSPPRGDGELVVAIGEAEHRVKARWTEPPEALQEIAGLMAARQDAAAFDRLWARLTRRSPAVDLWAGVERARSLQARGDADAAIDAWVDAANDARRLDAMTEVSRRFRAAAYIAWNHRRTRQMDRLLTEASEVMAPGLDPAGYARLRYMRGLLNRLMGDWESARVELRAAIRLFEDLGDDRAAYAAVETLALLLADLGRAKRALSTLEGIRDLKGIDDDARTRYALNLGWLTLRAFPRGPTDDEKVELRRRLDAGRSASKRQGNRLYAANAAVNQAWGALKLGDLDTAETRLEEARLLDPDGEGYAAPYATLLQARVDLARGRLDAAEAGFVALEARARHEQGEVSELGWRARFGLGRVSRARGDRAAARGHFDRALGIVDALGRRAALRGDRATFHADRGALVDEAIDLTVEHEPWRAFGYADAARARPMRALQADVRVGALDPPTRRRWAEALDVARAAAEAAREAHARLKIAPLAEEADRRREAEAADAAREAAFDAAFAVLDTATPAPTGIDGAALSRLLAPDEVLFAFHRRWAFRVDAAGTLARPLPTGDPLGDWRDLPPTVGHVYIVPGGHPEAFRLATAGARPLIERASVSFLPYAGLLQRAAESGDGAPLVVADARRDLAHAAAEGQSVASTLPGARLLRGDAADRASVLAALAETRLFHFAGHGVLHPERPWDAHLRLAGDDVLSLSDVLTHPLGARLVVLSGCETGVDAVLLDESVVGLPEAFLAAGAGAVLATDRPVDDQATRRFIDRFYAADGADDPAGGLRRAALTTRDAGDPAWHAFRLIGGRRAVEQTR